MNYLPTFTYTVSDDDDLLLDEDQRDVRYFQEFDDSSEQLILSNPHLGAYRVA